MNTGTPLPTDPRLRREAATMHAMINLYCRDHHGSQDDVLCLKCLELKEYANQRLARCPYKGNKPTCANCPIHCYQPEMRQRVREMMRYAGPRMLLRHPWLTILHLLDGLRKPRSLTRNGS